MRVTEIIIVLCILVFLGQGIIGPSFETHFVLSPAYLIDKPWTLLTSMFAHGGFTHLLFNMFALFIFGGALERKIGSGNFILLYLVSGVVGSIGFMLLASTPFSSALGASGAIYGVIGALALLRPNMVVYLMGVPMPMYVAGFIYMGIEVLGLGASDGIAHSAHLLGLFGGVGIGYWVNDKLEDMNIVLAVGVGLVSVIITSVVFGQYYNNELVQDIKYCEYQEISYAINCLLGTAQEQTSEHNKNIACMEYSRATYYARGYGYESAYQECMKG